MKYLKKLASVLLALVMVMALAAPAFAAEEKPGSITIDNAIPGESYAIYKIFDLESYGEGVQSYKINAAWTDFFNETPQSGYVEDLEDGFVNWVGPTTDTPQLADFAKNALAWAKGAGNVTPVKTEVAPDAAEGAETSTVTFTGLELGWYLLDSTVGTLCSLNATTPSATIKEKNELPTPDKKQDTNAVVKGVGDTITYTVEVAVKPGANNYVLRDTMSDGLTYNNNVTAKIKDTGTEVTLEDVTPLADGETFAKKIVDVGSYVGKTIVFTYTATINEKAVTFDKVTNTAKITYGDKNTPTEESEVEYDLYDLKIFKYTTGENDAEVKLDGAKFELYDDKTGGNKIPLIYVEAAGEADAYYRVATAEEQADAGFESAVIEAGEVIIKGLAAGTYWLEETEAPDGYNKLAERVDATVAAGVENTAKVLNNTGTQLPSTGGIGTTIFYVVGGVLMVGAVVVLIAKRRTGSDEE